MTKLKILLVLGANGFLGSHFLKLLSSSHSLYDRIVAIDISKSASPPVFSSDSNPIEYLTSDVIYDDYLADLSIPKDCCLTILNLVAKDFPVTAQGLNNSFKSPFCLPPADFSDSLITTSTSSYNIFYLLEKHSLLSSHVLLVGSIYSHILPKAKLYSHDASLWKPIAYSAGKFSQIPLYKQAAIYLAKFGGRCNCISFGGIQSDQNAEFVKSYSELAPQSRLVPIEDVTATILWMLSSSPTSVNGAELLVDGAFSNI